MPQSSVIFGALFIGFLVYITMKGELGAYGQAFFGTQAGPSTGDSSSSGGAGSLLGDVTSLVGGSGGGSSTDMMGMAAMAAMMA